MACAKLAREEWRNVVAPLTAGRLNTTSARPLAARARNKVLDLGTSLCSVLLLVMEPARTKTLRKLDVLTDTHATTCAFMRS